MCLVVFWCILGGKGAYLTPKQQIGVRQEGYLTESPHCSYMTNSHMVTPVYIAFQIKVKGTVAPVEFG
jgi:hypothetical protein